MTTPEPGYTEDHCANPSQPPLDWGYDSFFDTRPEARESYLYPTANQAGQKRWNTGSAQNIFLHFYVGGAV